MRNSGKEGSNVRDINITNKDGDNFGSRIKKIREEKGLNKAELARLVSVTRASLSKWEKGDVSDVSATTLARIADQLGVDMRTLLDGGVGRAGCDLTLMREAIIAVENNFPDRKAEDKAKLGSRFYDWLASGKDLDEPTMGILARM
ncbi:MAG: helix-turn-helix transcriptional regulator [Halieaceae bacterium]|nr:helix-turn-helix transcriptional regulator [Halieaceae bacterium]